MERILEPQAMQAWARERRAAGETVAFVPTMGYLHEGHLSLMRLARARADHLVVSIFVNPLQFAPNEDLATYPRDEEGDLAKCASVGADVVFFPTTASMYPPGSQTRVKPGPLAGPLCGRSRPTHFDGVVTVVLKLFNLVKPNLAVFGRKDFQQLQVIRRMVRDLDLDVEVVGGPIVREPDGLALSSRNAYLSADERIQALALSQSLALAEQRLAAGPATAEDIVALATAHIGAQSLGEIDYVELVDREELTPAAGPLHEPVLLAVAVRFGGTRLIDNRVLRP